MEGHNAILVWLIGIYDICNWWYKKDEKYSSGPRTEPWGTPVSMVVEGEDDESIFTKDERSVRYDRIQEIT